MPGELSTEQTLRENLADMTRRRDELDRQLDSVLKEAEVARRCHAAQELQLQQTVNRMQQAANEREAAEQRNAEEIVRKTNERDELLSHTIAENERLQHNLELAILDIEAIKKGRSEEYYEALDERRQLQQEAADLREELDAERASRDQERAQTHRLTYESEDKDEEIATLRAALRHTLMACSDLRNAAALLVLDGLEIPF